MDNESKLLLIYVACGIIGFLIAIFFARWVFRIDERVEYDKKQYMMLRQIALKSGVEIERVREIDNPSSFSRNKREAINKNDPEKYR